MQLQACDKCGAQFDVSGFAQGQQFSCGACGQVLTAHAVAAAGRPARVPGQRTPGSAPAAARTAAASAAPAPAARPGGAPMSRGRAGRGPQYTPPKREDAPAAAERPARRARGTRDAAGPRPGAPGGPGKGLVLGGIGVVALIVVALVAFGGDQQTDDPTGPGGTQAAGGGTPAGPPAEPARPTETLEQVMGEYLRNPPTVRHQYKAFIARLKALDDPGAASALKQVYRDYVEGPGGDDREAREALGYRRFDYEVPGDIAFRDFPYMRAVDAAAHKEWFGPDEDDAWELAVKARAETEEHRRRLVEDRSFRAGVEARALLAQDQHFREYNYATRWADPYLICYASSQDRMSEFDLLSIEDPAERRRKLDELHQRRRRFDAVLDEKAAIFTQLYKHFLDRYGEKLRLKHLMDEYGGRPDYPVGVRSFADGQPLIIWIFDSKASFDEFHTKIKQEPIPHNVAGYFSPQTGYVYLYDEGENPENRVFEINKNVHEGVHQLEHWFTRQRNKWRKPLPGQDFFGEGIAEYVGSVQMQPDQALKFIGVNVPRLKNMQQAKKQLDAGGGKYPIFPIRELTRFTSYGEVQGWGATEWRLHPDLVLSLFYQQSWAFVYFLNEYKDGKYRERFLTFFDLVLHRETGFGKGSEAFREAFRIRADEDWEDLDEEFRAFVTDDLMKRDATQYDYTPPKRAS